MKKIFFSIVALAALAACTKSEVQYETPGEISFAPAVENATKAAISGTYPDQPLRVFAVYGDAADQTTVADGNIESFSTLFLNDAIFTKKTATAWGGAGDGYSWPNNGSLVFAGYAVPDANSLGDVEYDFVNDVLSIEGYVQSTNTASTFDLAWFGRTEKSYNLKATPTQTVPVTLSHALAWIEIKVKGEGTTIATGNPWKITSVTMNNVSNTGNVLCKKDGSAYVTIWDNLGNTKDSDDKDEDSILIYSGGQELSGTAAKIETNDAGTLVIPQTPTAITPNIPDDDEVATLTVVYTYKSPASNNETTIWMPDQTVTVPLVVTGGWKSGYKYTYTLTFNSSEILITPTYGAWDKTTNPEVTVE